MPAEYDLFGSSEELSSPLPDDEQKLYGLYEGLLWYTKLLEDKSISIKKFPCIIDEIGVSCREVLELQGVNK